VRSFSPHFFAPCCRWHQWVCVAALFLVAACVMRTRCALLSRQERSGGVLIYGEGCYSSP
jgi:hypothetical protein